MYPFEVARGGASLSQRLWRCFGVRWLMTAILTLTCWAGEAVAQSGGAGFTIIVYDEGGIWTSFRGVSGDGSIAVGSTGGFGSYELFIASGSTAGVLPSFPPGASNEGRGISADGLVVIGTSTLGTTRAAVWPTGGTPFLLRDENGDLPTATTLPLDLSGDGSVIVGQGNFGNGGSEAFRWTAETGMVGIGDLDGGGFQSVANGVSNDGSVVVGSGATDMGGEAFRWTAETGMVGLGRFPGGTTASGAYGISGDGSVIVGHAGVPGSGIQRVPVRWTASHGWEELGLFPPEEQPNTARSGQATGASYDGSVIVGDALALANGNKAFFWTEATGLRSLQQFLLDEGVTAIENWKLSSAFISDNGRYIVGIAEHTTLGGVTPYVAKLPDWLFDDGLEGDFDEDGDVDGHDFLLWQRNPSIGDLEVWQNNFGNPTTGAASGNPLAIPEPTSAGMLGLSAILILAGRRRMLLACQ